MSKSLREQLAAAFASSGLTVDQLLSRSGLKMDATSLGRKLNGRQTLRVEECEALANALQVRVSIGRRAQSS